MLFVLDASAVLNDFGFEFRKNHSYIVTSRVFLEFRDLRSRNLADNALKQGILKIMEPSHESMHRARELANMLEYRAISDADCSILGIALDLKNHGVKFSVITDDRAMQKICLMAGIAFEAVIRGKAKKGKERSKAMPRKGKQWKKAKG